VATIVHARAPGPCRPAPPGAPSLAVARRTVRTRERPELDALVSGHHVSPALAAPSAQRRGHADPTKSPSSGSRPFSERRTWAAVVPRRQHETLPEVRSCPPCQSPPRLVTSSRRDLPTQSFAFAGRPRPARFFSVGVQNVATGTSWARAPVAPVRRRRLRCRSGLTTGFPRRADRWLRPVPRQLAPCGQPPLVAFPISNRHARACSTGAFTLAATCVASPRKH
jgi:hypothetical protein